MRLVAAMGAVLAPFCTAIWASAAVADTPECAAGRNVIAEMPVAEREALRARADTAPYARGNFWRATRGDQVVDLVGTYHLEDPRHEVALAHIVPLIAKSSTLLVEAGPDEEKALIEHIAADPSMVMITDGPTLDAMLPPDEWTELSKALGERNILPALAARFRPWYLTVVLAIPACKMAQAQNAKGLDKQLIAAAKAAEIPVRALEPYQTVFQIFADMPLEDQLSMIRTTLATEDRSADFTVTLADAYFAQESLVTWELMRDVSAQIPGQSPAEMEAEFARIEEALMNRRNRDWIPVIEEAAANGPVVAAFGALHLSGDQGVLNLMAAQGWTLVRQEF